MLTVPSKQSNLANPKWFAPMFSDSNYTLQEIPNVTVTNLVDGVGNIDMLLLFDGVVYLKTKSGHHAEKEIGKTLEKIHLLSTLLNFCPLYKRLNQKPSDTKPSDHYQLQLALSTKLQRTSTNNTKPKVAKSENIGANHLGFAKSLFQHYCQYLGLNYNYISTELVFNFYVNKKIFSLLRTPINKEIEHHTQQRYPITYASKGKGKLQTPAVTPRKIQSPAWKKNKVEFPSNPSYHYTPGSAINISSTDAFPSTATSAFGRFPFQSRQRKTELLGPYGKYFEGFNLQSSTPLGFRSPPLPPDFGISDPWEAAESKKEEEKSEDQEFTYQHPITENLEVETSNIQTQQQLENPEIKTPNIRMPPNQRNQNPKLINQQNLSPVIIIDQPLINPIAEPIQQPLQLPPQQPGQQQLLQQPPQPPNLDPMAYAPIAKLDNFMGEENNTQIWLNDVEKAIAANGWNDA
ncbi:hypothetical protein G9A89_023851 [Geosiphon pyriformis]|nr:hypothetical protein G9A89_023851 [Geosiphon pyriformis]